MMDCYKSVYCLSFITRIPSTRINKQKPDHARQTETSFSTVEKVFDPLYFGFGLLLQNLLNSTKALGLRQ